MAKQAFKGNEFIRKRIVDLKRKPQIVAMIVLGIAFLFYSLNLTQISNTTAKIQGPGMGLAGFSTMLFSMLSLVCFGNAFPHRKKVNIPMLVLMYAMLLIVIFADLYYGGRITAAVTRAENPIDATGNNSYISAASVIVRVHVILVILGGVVTALLPVYSKWIRSINTSIEVEGNDNMGVIGFDDEDN